MSYLFKIKLIKALKKINATSLKKVELFSLPEELRSALIFWIERNWKEPLTKLYHNKPHLFELLPKCPNQKYLYRVGRKPISTLQSWSLKPQLDFSEYGKKPQIIKKEIPIENRLVWIGGIIGLERFWDEKEIICIKK